MKRMLVFFSDKTDAAYNMALEEFILDKYTNQKDNTFILLLWQNNKAVIIGCNQNARNECNMNYLRDNNIQVVRRKTGGGAVFHDMGNLNFSFIHPKETKDTDRSMNVLCKALARFGILAKHSGRNDIEVSGKKVSGSAFMSNEKLSLHHGTFLLHVDLDTMIKALNVPKEKIEPKGIESVRSRVINLRGINSKINVEALEQALVNEFAIEYCCEEIIENKHILLGKDDQKVLDNLISSYKSDSWNLGINFNFTKVKNKRYSWGGVEIRLLIEKNIIHNLRIYSDSLNPNIIREVEEAIKNIEFNGDVLIREIGRMKDKYNDDTVDMLEDILNLLLE